MRTAFLVGCVLAAVGTSIASYDFPGALIVDKDKREYTRLIELRVVRWQVMITSLKDDVESASPSNVNDNIKKLIADLDTNLKLMEEQLVKLKFAGTADWRSLQEVIEKQFEQLRRTYWTVLQGLNAGGTAGS